MNKQSEVQLGDKAEVTVGASMPLLSASFDPAILDDLLKRRSNSDEVKVRIGTPSIVGINRFSYYYWDPDLPKNAGRKGRQGLVIYFNDGVIDEWAWITMY